MGDKISNRDETFYSVSDVERGKYVVPFSLLVNGQFCSLVVGAKVAEKVRLFESVGLATSGGR